MTVSPSDIARFQELQMRVLKAVRSARSRIEPAARDPPLAPKLAAIAPNVAV
jgi:hypothetical protein